MVVVRRERAFSISDGLLAVGHGFLTAGAGDGSGKR